MIYAILGGESLNKENYFKSFCDDRNYKGTINYNEGKDEYSIIISSNDNNAGLFLTKKEYESFSYIHFTALIDYLDKQFKHKFNN